MKTKISCHTGSTEYWFIPKCNCKGICLAEDLITTVKLTPWGLKNGLLQFRFIKRLFYTVTDNAKIFSVMFDTASFINTRNNDNWTACKQ